MYSLNHVCSNFIPYLLCAMCDCPPCPFLVSLPVLHELEQADLITGGECRVLSNVIQVQSGKSPEVQTRTADVLRRHGFEEESNLLAGNYKQTQPSSMYRGVLYSGV